MVEDYVEMWCELVGDGRDQAAEQRSWTLVIQREWHEAVGGEGDTRATDGPEGWRGERDGEAITQTHPTTRWRQIVETQAVSDGFLHVCGHGNICEHKDDGDEGQSEGWWMVVMALMKIRTDLITIWLWFLILLITDLIYGWMSLNAGDAECKCNVTISAGIMANLFFGRFISSFPMIWPFLRIGYRWRLQLLSADLCLRDMKL